MSDKICPVCGYHNKSFAEYCEKCLFELKDVEVPQESVPEDEGLELEDIGVYCPNGHWNPAGSKFCQVCGAKLVDSEMEKAEGSVDAEADVEETPDAVFKLVSRDLSLVVDLPFVKGKVKKMLVGRKSGDMVPDVDLSNFEGSGIVSRRHLNIILDGNSMRVYIEDLGSTNGTRINGKPVERGVPHPLRSGESFEIGRDKGFKFTLEENE